MAHELDTRLNRRICKDSYVPEADIENDDDLLGLEEDLNFCDNYQDTNLLGSELKKVNCYIRFLHRFSYIVILLVLLLSVGCGVLIYFKAPLPDFGDDPTKGFETRDTPIHNHAYTLKNLWQHKDKDYILVPNVTKVYETFNIPKAFRGQEGALRRRRDLGGDFNSDHDDFLGSEATDWAASPWRRGGESSSTDHRRKRAIDDPSAEYPCGPVGIDWNAKKDNYKFYIVPRGNLDLLTLEGLQGICQLEEEFIKPNIQKQCQIKSLPRFLLRETKNVTGRCDLEESDVQFLRDLLDTCHGYYYNFTLPYSRGHQNLPPTDMPSACARHADFIHDVIYYFAPIGFFNVSRESRVLTAALTFLDYLAAGEPRDLYVDHYEDRVIRNDRVQLTALAVPGQDNVKYFLFNKYLMQDLERYFSLAMALILLIMLLYSRSFVLMLATILNVAFSYTLACGIYFFVLRMTFYPFINLLAGLVLIAVGADDVFIFYDTWQQVQEKNPGLPLDHVLSRTFSHAALSIFVTSFTTASAFFANTVSTITCIQCFGIFSGTAILVNFLLMVTWTPAVIVAMERASRYLAARCERSSANGEGLVGCWRSMTHALRRVSVTLFDTCFPALIRRAWAVWLPLFLLLGVGGAVVVFVKPKLKLPESQDFQLFPDSNLLENWDNHFQDAFPFMVDDQDEPMISLYFVFGFKALETGNRLDPDDQGANMTEDANFNFYAPETQSWLLTLCQSLKNQSFLLRDYQHEPCALSSYGDYFKTYCRDPRFAPFIKPHGCCHGFEPPYDQDQLRTCLPGLVSLMGSHARFLGEPIYDPDNNVKGFFMFVLTKLRFSMSYEVMNGHYATLKTFFDDQLEGAPEGLASGFFAGRYTFTFYDLQRAIANGTYYSIGLSLAVALVVMLLTSLNLLITLYALVTIALAISTTVASIVLLGWHLNIVESITISLAVGLSIDFTIHYGVAYRLSKAHDPRARVHEAFSRVGAAVFMAALTTFAAGAAMLPSHILAYTKLGVFLMLVMTISWLYATFFFQSVCHVIGPRGTFCQVPVGRGRCGGRKEEETLPDAATSGGGGDFAQRSAPTLSIIAGDEDDDYLVTF